MKKVLLMSLLFLVATVCKGDKIYIKNYPYSYNSADAQLVAAMESLGHEVTVASFFSAFPSDLTSTCVDPVNGYDWLCFFGNYNYVSLIPNIQSFVNDGGKVFFQYEISCCVISSSSTAQIISALTGLTIVPSSVPAFANGWLEQPGYYAAPLNCCANLLGSAFKSMVGLPEVNQLKATGILNNGTPGISSSPNFGFVFGSEDLPGGTGAITGIGDYNIWYSGYEPPWVGGTSPINMSTVRFFFPNTSASCNLFPPGCTNSITLGEFQLEIGDDVPICDGDSVHVNLEGLSGTIVWNDGSVSPVQDFTTPGIYAVELTNECGVYTDSISITVISTVLELGNDTLICDSEPIVLDATGAGDSFIWNTGHTGSSHLVAEPGEYSVLVGVEECWFSDTINVGLLTEDLIDIGPLYLCENEELNVQLDPQWGSFIWYDGSLLNENTIGSIGNYWVTVSNSCFTVTDTFTVVQTPLADLEEYNEITLCQNQTEQIGIAVPGATYQWYNNAVTPYRVVGDSGIYTVSITHEGCEVSITYDVQVVICVSIPEHEDGKDIVIFPNPAAENISIALPKGNWVGGDVELFNDRGKIVLQRRINSNGLMLLSLNDLPTGAYVLKAMAVDGSVIIGKVLVCD